MNPVAFVRYLVPRFLITVALVLTWIGMTPVSMAAVSCANGALPIDQTLTGGARWEMCYRNDPSAGIVYTNIHYTTPTGVRRRVLNEIAIGQVNVVLDDESQSFSHVTGQGFGGASLNTLGAANCAGGTLYAAGGRNLICGQIESRGYAWKYYASYGQGTELALSSLATLPTGNYITRLRFFDDGAIEPSIGHTGEIEFIGTDSDYGWKVSDAGDTTVIATGFSVEYIWRLDFAIGTSENDDLVEMLEVVPAADRMTKTLSLTPVMNEDAWRFDPDTKRSWRVRDSVEVNSEGRAVSYHLQPISAGYTFRETGSRTWTDNDVFVTVDDGCERFASSNTGSCGASVDEYVNGEVLSAGADVVLWYRTAFHRLPRIEDRDGFKVDWNRFILLPRDWTASSPLS